MLAYNKFEQGLRQRTGLRLNVKYTVFVRAVTWLQSSRLLFSYPSYFHLSFDTKNILPSFCSGTNVWLCKDLEASIMHYSIANKSFFYNKLLN